MPNVATHTWWSRLWRPFWSVPLTACVMAFALGYTLPLADEAIAEHLPYVFPGGPSGARDFLGTIASAMISVTGLVFSITLVVLQLASSQFSPRVLGNFLQSRITQLTLGVFAGSFIYALTVLRAVRGGYGDASEFVPQASVSLAFVLVLMALGMFIGFIHHITTTIQVSQVISRIGQETVSVIRGYFPEPDQADAGAESAQADQAEPGDGAGTEASRWRAPPAMRRSAVTSGSRHGHLTQIDYEALWDCAQELDVIIEVMVPVGQFVPENDALITVWGSEDLEDSARRTIGAAAKLEAARSVHQDPAFGVRQLVDIADRALSAGINDPTTATQVIDELHRILRILVRRVTPRAVLDQRGTTRLIHRPQTVPELISLAIEEIVHYGADSVQVPTRLRHILTDLLRCARPEYRPLISRWLAEIPDLVPKEARP